MKSIAMIHFLVVLLLPLTGIAQVNIDWKTVPPTAALFQEKIVTTPLNERDFALSPDGSEILYTIQVQSSLFQSIVYMKKDKKGNWSKPEVVSFSGHYSDLEPAFSSDGKKLFFTSNRPVSGNEAKDFDIWVTERAGDSWTEPKNIGAPVNTPADEFYPSVAQNGNLYFTAQYKKGVGKEDIYVAKWAQDHYAEPEVLDTGVNTALYEFNAFVSPDEQFILFTSYGRKDDTGRGDLYISLKDKDGHWQPAKNLTFLNSVKLDYCPFVSFDKKMLFFTSERHNLPSSYPGNAVTYHQLQETQTTPLNGVGNIYWVSFEEVMKKLK